MKHYCQCYVNSRNGEIDHIAVSDMPLQRDHVRPSIPDEIPTIPPTPPLTYAIHEFEIDIDDDQGFIRGNELLAELEISNGTVRMRSGATEGRTIPDESKKPARDFGAQRGIQNAGG